MGDFCSRRFVLCSASLATPSAHGRDICGVSDFLRAVCTRSEFDKRVERYIHPGALRLVVLHEVGVDAAKHCLMRNNQNVFTALKLHDDRLEANDHISVRFTARVAIVVLVFITSDKVLRVSVFDFLVG